MDGLDGLGWDAAWEAEYHRLVDPGDPARVIAQERDRWIVRTAAGEAHARLTARPEGGILPVVGDWVIVAPGPSPSDPLTINRVLPRRSSFERGAAGGGGHPQVLAANLDEVWIVHGLDTPPNLRRLERYLAMAWQSGAVPSILLTKVDLAQNVDEAMEAVRGIAIGVPVHAVGARDPDSVARLHALLTPGRTVVLLGPSGAGKSTLVNLLSHTEVAATADVRPTDRKGRHTTTRRQLFTVAAGALIIDTPGLRELRVWDLDEGLERAYPDIEDLATRCRFADCRHEAEPQCAVLAAVEAGELPSERLASYRKLQAEVAYMERRSDPRARQAAVADHKTALKTMRFHHKRRDPD